MNATPDDFAECYILLLRELGGDLGLRELRQMCDTQQYLTLDRRVHFRDDNRHQCLATLEKIIQAAKDVPRDAINAAIDQHLRKYISDREQAEIKIKKIVRDTADPQKWFRTQVEKLPPGKQEALCALATKLRTRNDGDSPFIVVFDAEGEEAVGVAAVSLEFKGQPWSVTSQLVAKWSGGTRRRTGPFLHYLGLSPDDYEHGTSPSIRAMMKPIRINIWPT
jgi:hypothetical protein